MTVFYIYGWFECLALVLLCLGLLGAAWRMPLIILAATVQCVGVGIIRSFTVGTGVNTIAAIILLALLIAWLFSRPIGKSLAAASCTILVMLGVELTAMFIASQFIDITASVFAWLLVGIPHIVVLFGIAVLVRVRNLAFFR